MVEPTTQHPWFEVPMAFQRLDLEGHILEVNNVWLQLSGYALEECLGRPYMDFVPNEHLADFERNLSQLRETGRLDGADCFLCRKDGIVLNVRIFGRLNRATSEAECMIIDITGFRQTERDLKDSEQRFRNLFDLAPTPVVIHDGERILLANRAAAEFLGYDLATDLLGVAISGLVHVDDRLAVIQRIQKMMAQDWTAPPQTERFIRRDGLIVYGEAIASPVVFEGKRVIHVVVLDLTEQMEAERALLESESRYRTLFEFSADAVVVHDGRYVRFVNQSAMESFGMPLDADVEGVDLLDYVHPDSIAAVSEAIGVLLSGVEEDRPTEYRLLRADGSDWYAESFAVTVQILSLIHI